MTMSRICSLPSRDACDESLPSQARSQSSWPEHAAIPELFVCPLSKRLMKDPVIDREGNSYEREAILSHLRQPGEGTSPVTKNPLRERDLVDNKALLAAIDAVDGSRKSVLEEKTQSRSRARRGFRRIANPLSSSVKAAVRRVSTSLGHDAARPQCDLKIDPEGELKGSLEYEAPRDSVRTEMSALTEPTMEEIDEGQRADAPTQETTISIASGSVPNADEELRFRPQLANDRGHRTKSRKSIQKHCVGNNAKRSRSASQAAQVGPHKTTSSASTQKRAIGTDKNHTPRLTFASEHSEIGTAVDKFEERLRKKLSEDPAARARYERAEKKREDRIRKKLSEDRAARGSKERASSCRDVGGDSEKRVAPSSILEQSQALATPKKEEVSPGGKNPNRSEDRSEGSSGPKDAPGEDARHARLQERRKEWSRKRSAYVQKRSAKSLRQATDKVTPIESTPEKPPAAGTTASPKPAKGNKSASDKLAKFEDKLRKRLSEDPAARARYERKSRQLIREFQEASADSTTRSRASDNGADKLVTFEDKLRKKLSEDPTARARYERTSRQLQNKESQEASADSVTRSHAPDDGTDKLMTFEDKLRKKLSEDPAARARYQRKARRRESPQSKESQEAGDDSATRSHTPDNVPQVEAVSEDGRPKRRDRRGKADRKVNGRSRGKARRSGLGEVNYRKLSSEMSELTWDDLDGEVARAMFLSMPPENANTAELQAGMEAKIQAEFEELGSCISGDRSGGVRGDGGRGPGGPETSTPGPDTTFSGKVRLLMEVVEGSSKTRIDVMRALKEARGDMGDAATILLQ